MKTRFTLTTTILRSLAFALCILALGTIRATAKTEQWPQGSISESELRAFFKDYPEYQQRCVELFDLLLKQKKDGTYPFELPPSEDSFALDPMTDELLFLPPSKDRQERLSEIDSLKETARTVHLQRLDANKSMHPSKKSALNQPHLVEDAELDSSRTTGGSLSEQNGWLIALVILVVVMGAISIVVHAQSETLDWYGYSLEITCTISAPWTNEKLRTEWLVKVDVLHCSKCRYETALDMARSTFRNCLSKYCSDPDRLHVSCLEDLLKASINGIKKSSDKHVMEIRCESITPTQPNDCLNELANLFSRSAIEKARLDLKEAQRIAEYYSVPREVGKHIDWTRTDGGRTCWWVHKIRQPDGSFTFENSETWYEEDAIEDSPYYDDPTD